MYKQTLCIMKIIIRDDNQGIHNGELANTRRKCTIDSLNNSIEFGELFYDYVTASIKY